MTIFGNTTLPHLGKKYFRRDKKIPKTFYRITVKGIIVRDDGAILLLKEPQRTCFDLPGGGLEWGEELYAGLAREISEEIGLETQDFCISNTPAYVYIAELEDLLGDNELYPVCMFCYFVKLKHFDFIESSEYTGYEWVSIENFPKYQIWSHSAELSSYFSLEDVPKEFLHTI